MKYLALIFLFGCVPDAYNEGAEAAKVRCDCMDKYEKPTMAIYKDCIKAAEPAFKEKMERYRDNIDAQLEFNEGYAKQLIKCGADTPPAE